MNIFALIVAFCAVVFGVMTVFKQQTTLFYKIVVFSAGSYLLAVIYRVLYAILIPVPAFHAGYLTYAGTFLFLLSGFFAEPKETFKGIKTRAKVPAMIPALVIIAWGVWNTTNGHSVLSQLLLIPVALTAYYAFLGLLIPSKAGEYAYAMRVYHIIVLLFCLMQPIMLVSMLTREHTTLPILFHSLLSAATVIIAYWGCKRWSI